MSELFDIPESLSPRLAWMRRHELTVSRLENGKYRCQLDDANFQDAETAEEACLLFCMKTELPHWSL